MEKVMMSVRAPVPDDKWCSELRKRVVELTTKADFSGVTINVRDSPVTDSIMTLTTLEPPIVAVISVWTHQNYGPGVSELINTLESDYRNPDYENIAAYLVTESIPLPPPVVESGTRTPGLANMAFLRRPEHIDEQTWLRRWHLDHTSVAIETQSTFGYVQNAVVRPLTATSPPLTAIVEELFPIEAVHDVHAFFGAADDKDLADRMGRMLASTGAFGADQNIDTVPTSRYVYSTPFRD
ncbi:EthD domain-containing protein [Williamsia sp. D3]|uniref:EthD domain-containing protein n=1 Tax=Williamsia sp. D3 TaxID=1313067 RepID=UPI0003D2EF38|nr:EthD domain-containing protein [Williamsia sp. D3]ETD32320.1 hypothetical protein W823_13175 [Williamsia sp. D3]